MQNLAGTYLSYARDRGELVENTPVRIEEHEVEEYYKLIPAYYAIDALGAINKYNPIEVTNQNSIMFYDSIAKDIVNVSIEEARKEPERYFVILGAPRYDLNDTVYIETKRKNDSYESAFELNHINGFLLAMYLKHLAGAQIIASSSLYDYLKTHESIWSKWFKLRFEFYKKTFNSSIFEIQFEKIYDKTPFKALADAAIFYRNGLYYIANELVYSSNIEFVIGMLEGFIYTEKQVTHEISELLTANRIHVNVYTNILNYLFADYKIVKAKYKGYSDESIFAITFSLSPQKFDHLRYQTKIREKIWTWHINANGDLAIDKWSRNFDPSGAASQLIYDLMHYKSKDMIKFVRFDEFIVNHVRADEPVKMYDFVMGGEGDSNNYLLPLGPFSKNSDGDILTIMGLMSEDAIESAKKHALTDASRMRDALDPDNVSNWIQKDAVGGLYVATKER